MGLEADVLCIQRVTVKLEPSGAVIQHTQHQLPGQGGRQWTSLLPGILSAWPGNLKIPSPPLHSLLLPLDNTFTYGQGAVDAHYFYACFWRRLWVTWKADFAWKCPDLASFKIGLLGRTFWALVSPCCHVAACCIFDFPLPATSFLVRDPVSCTGMRAVLWSITYIFWCQTFGELTGSRSTSHGVTWQAKLILCERVHH